MMTVGEMCAGYNGLGKAVEEVFDATPAWFFEFDAAPSKILAHHYPDVPNHGDMTAVDWSQIEPVDIISGGTPCQDLSGAGKRAGMTEGTRSNLWVQMREAIAIIQPRYVVWENVGGAYSAGAYSELESEEGRVGSAGGGGPVLRALGRVLGDLSSLGYDCQWRGLRAADVGAPHGRFRVFILATHRDGGRSRRGPTIPGDGISTRADAQAHGANDRFGEPITAERLLGSGWNPTPGKEEVRGPSSEPRRRCGTHLTANTQGDGWNQGRAEPTGIERGSDASLGSDTDWGTFGPAVRRWEQVMGRRAPAPTEPTGRNGNHRLSARFTEWMMGQPDGWITDPAIGLTRNEQLKACGNGVVTQQAVAALRAMLGAQMEVAA